MGPLMALMLNMIYISSPGPTKHNTNNVLYLYLFICQKTIKTYKHTNSVIHTIKAIHTFTVNKMNN